jgi:SH3 domain-containing YSC84-like protein 1
MKKIIYLITVVAALPFAQGAFASVAPADISHRVGETVNSLQELLAVPEKAIPTDLMQAATCVATINVYKGGLGLGAAGGSGMASCREASGAWGAPFFINMTAVSFGFQIGFEKVDLTLVFTNKNAREDLTSTNFKLGGDVGLTVGPVGRDLSAGTNYSLKDTIYSYSTTKGLFGGLTLDGSLLFADGNYDVFVYGNATPTQIIEMTPHQTPASVVAFTNALNQYSR